MANPKNSAPYAYPSNVFGVVSRLRNAALPDPLDAEAVQRIGIPAGNSHRTVAAFRFLGLIDEKGKHTKLMQGLARATSQEYPNVLGDILRNAYADIFAIVNLDTASEIEIDDAFRGYSPETQRKRMVKLFMNLSQEANLLKGELVNVQQSEKPKPRSVSSGPRMGPLNSSTPSKSSSVRSWMEYTESLFEQLPEFDDASWTSAERDKWLNAIASLLDVRIDVED